jgi:flagella basal body P-ring formation protein FlgA
MKKLTQILGLGLVAFTMNATVTTLDAQAAQGAPSKVESRMAALNERISVSDQYILLGDLFDNAGEQAGKAVAYAPRPGRKAVFEARWLYKVARAYKLNWRPMDANVRAIVVRDSNVIYRTQVEEEIIAALADHGAPADIMIDLNNRSFKIHVSANKAPTVEVEEIQYDARSRRFSAILAAPAGDPSAQRYRLSGRVHPVQEIPVPARRISKGDIIGEKDIKWVKVRTDRIDQTAVVNMDQLVGMTPTRVLSEGINIRSRDVRRPLEVTKRSMVTLVLQTPLMTMTAKGVSLDNGAKGEVIRVTNSKTKAIVEAVVIGQGRAAVTADTIRTNTAQRIALK